MTRFDRRIIKTASTALAATLAIAVITPIAAHAQDSTLDFAALAEKTVRRPGLFDLHADPATGKLYAVFQAKGDHHGRYILTNRLTAGLGSNPVGLDRGFGNSGSVVRIEKVGDRVQFIVENHRYKAVGAGVTEALATERSFAESVIWTGPIADQDGAGRALVDITDFLLSDRINVVGRLKAGGQGSFSLDKDRSAVLLDEALAFPENVEIDARLTFTSNEPGGEVDATAPDARAATLVLHHSFVALPDDGYQVREADQRMGGFEMARDDTAAPLDRPVRGGLAVRHRLHKTDPTAASSPVVEPIVYYVDSGAPDRVREALVEGAAWWSQAFEAAGFEDAYRVEVLPEDAHPLDARYNVIQWVHRQTRGWSYGASVVDPRTGEIIKGAVILGSQRVRQDRMIFEGLLGAAKTGTGAADDPTELALSRIRQLSAHEVGHTLGLAHNFSASSQDRASVMDYPAPYVTLGAGGDLDVSEAYDTDIGEWDKAAVSWLYADLRASGDPEGDLARIVRETQESGLLYMSDRHARGGDSADPRASLWDNGADPVAHLGEVMAVRAQALADFGPGNLAEGRPLSDLRAVFVPIYLYHRYQTEAAAKAVGGRRFAFQSNDGAVAPMETISPQEQRAALDAVLATLSDEALAVPDDLAPLLQPHMSRDYDGALTRELFASAAYPAFSEEDAAGAAARLTLQAVLSPPRLARVAAQAEADADQLDLIELFDAVEGAVRPENAETAVGRGRANAYRAELIHLVQHGAPAVAAEAHARLDRLARGARRGLFGSNPDAFAIWYAAQAQSALDGLKSGRDLSPARPALPPGSPIGCGHDPRRHGAVR